MDSTIRSCGAKRRRLAQKRRLANLAVADIDAMARLVNPP